MFPGLSADSAGKDTVVLQVNILMSSTNDLEWSTVLPIVPNSGRPFIGTNPYPRTACISEARDIRRGAYVKRGPVAITATTPFPPSMPLQQMTMTGVGLISKEKFQVDMEDSQLLSRK